MLVSPVQCDRSPAVEGSLLTQHVVHSICSPFVTHHQCKFRSIKEMTSWIKMWIRFILNLLHEAMSVVLIWQAAQSFQKRLASLKASQFSKELGRLISHSLRVCTRAYIENQTTSREGIPPKITSKGWPHQCPAEIGNTSNLAMFLH